MIVLDVSSAAIKDTNAAPIADGTNNNINDKIDADILAALNAAIKHTDVEPTTSRVNNDMNGEFDASTFMGRAINKKDAEFNMGGLGETSIILKKEICKSNLF